MVPDTKPEEEGTFAGAGEREEKAKMGIREHATAFLRRHW
jgi:hypothetical protein